MTNGYQIIEPAPLSDLLGAPLAFDVAVALLSWLVQVTREELKEDLHGAELEVIRADYHGAYPAIGIRYALPDARDIGPLVEMTMVRLIHERSTIDFVAFLVTSATDWRRETDRLLGLRSRP